MFQRNSIGWWGGLAACLAMWSAAAAHADDLRTWSDASGKFKIKAKFVSEADGNVTLEQEDGSEIEIELKKLSAADQKAVADLKKQAADSPFKSKSSSPFAPKSKGNAKTAAAGKSPAPAADAGGEPRNVTVNWASVESLSTAASGTEWKVEIGSAPEELAKPKAVPLPGKSNFFEGLKGLAVNPVAKKAAVGFVLGEPKPQGTTRVVICDLETGRASNPAVTSGQLVPLALSDDGKQVVMRRDEFGFGNHDRLELWTVTGSRVQKLVAWTPYSNVQGGDRDINWGAYLDADHLATYSAGGDLAVWKLPEVEAEYHVPIPGGGVPALSPDRKLIGYCDGKNVGLFDVEQKTIVAQQAIPASLHAPRMAFSPSGKRLACISHNQVLVWDVADGNLLQNMEATGLSIFGAIDFPSESYVLGGNKYLIDVDNQLKLWTYDGAEQVSVLGGWTLFAVMDGQKSRTLLPVKLPHPTAADVQKKTASDPTLFILRPETKVRIDVSGIPDAGQQEKVQRGLTKQLATIHCQADPNGTITLAASMEGPKARTLSLRNSGDYNVQEYTSRVKFLFQNKPVWETASSNVPGGPVIWVNLEKGENIGDWLKKKEKPDYGLFERVTLPKYLQKPSASTGPTNSQTLGTSKVTTAGIR